MKVNIRRKIYDRRLAALQALRIALVEQLQPPKLPKPTPALLILKRGGDYFPLDYVRYRDIFVTCICGASIRPIPRARCVSCRAEVEKIVDDEALRQMAARCRAERPQESGESSARSAGVLVQPQKTTG